MKRKKAGVGDTTVERVFKNGRLQSKTVTVYDSLGLKEVVDTYRTGETDLHSKSTIFFLDADKEQVKKAIHVDYRWNSGYVIECFYTPRRIVGAEGENGHNRTTNERNGLLLRCPAFARKP